MRKSGDMIRDQVYAFYIYYLYALIIVLEHGITRAPKSKFVLCPQISLIAVQCMFVLAFLNMNCSLLCCYTFYKGVFRNFQGVLLLG